MNAEQSNALTQAINALATAVATVVGARPAPPRPIHDLFASGEALDLGNRTGMQAFDKMSKPLPQVWDGTVPNFPSFLANLTLRANKAKWNVNNDTGILQIGGKDLFISYQSITKDMIQNARAARTNQRAKQNVKALFHCLEYSISGSVKTVIFAQTGNIPTHEDGVALFKLITQYTVVSSLQLSNLSLQQILEFNPAESDFNIPDINTKLINLFTLATTQNRVLDQNERIQHSLNIYSRILQPELWAQWVRNQTDKFDAGQITDSQGFMNEAVIKYNKIIAEKGKFEGSNTTIQEDIIAMFSKHAKGIKQKLNSDTNDTEAGDKKQKPPFLRDTESTVDGKRVKHKLGDTKVWKGTTLHYCDCPKHLKSLHWHTHKPADCRTRQRWIKAQARDTAQANLAGNAQPGEANDAAHQPNQQIQTLLASALNMTSDNDVVCDTIADALNALT